MRARVVLVALAVLVAGCSGDDTSVGSTEASGQETPTTPTATIATDAAPAPNGSGAAVKELDELLAATRKERSGHVELRRHLGMPGERLVEIIEGDFDRDASTASFVQRFEVSEGMRAAIPVPAGAPPIEQMRTRTIRIGTTWYVGSSTGDAEPAVWLRYDDASAAALGATVSLDLDGPLVPLLDTLEMRAGTPLNRRGTITFDSGPVTTYGTNAAPASVLLELGRRVVTSTGADAFIDDVTVDIPVEIQMNGKGTLIVLSVEATALYRDVAARSGVRAAKDAAAAVSSVRSELRLSSLGAPVRITAPPAEKVRKV